MTLARPLSQRQLDAIGNRIRAWGDMPIKISALAFARLCLTAQVPYSFGSHLLERLDASQLHREIEAVALWALVAIAESKVTVTEPPANARLHRFDPDPKHPWFCRQCGYGPGETLKHSQDQAA